MLDATPTRESVIDLESYERARQPRRTRKQLKLSFEARRSILERDRGFTVEEARRRIGAHVSIDEKMKFADFVIYNDGSIEETRRQVEKIYDQILLEERHV